MSWFAARHPHVDAHFAGTSTPAQDRRMWLHLPGCAPCRRRYRDLALLEALEPDADDRSRRRVGRAVFASLPRRRRRFALLGGFSLVVAAAAVALLVGDPGGDYAGIRGSQSPVLASLTPFRVPPDGRAEPLGGQMDKGDALAFTYTNPAAQRWEHLMVFAVDGERRVHWYWPAWQQASADPAAVAIAPSEAPVELREAVRHPFNVGHVTLFGLFTHRPYRVTEVEQILAAPGGAAALDGHLWTQTLEVSP